MDARSEGWRRLRGDNAEALRAGAMFDQPASEGLRSDGAARRPVFGDSCALNAFCPAKIKAP
jgi:hypothetical protein